MIEKGVKEGCMIEAENSNTLLVSLKERNRILPRYLYLSIDKESFIEQCKQRNTEIVESKYSRIFRLKSLEGMFENIKKQYSNKVIRAEEVGESVENIKYPKTIQEALSYDDRWVNNLDAFLNQIQSIGRFVDIENGVKRTYVPEIMIVEEFNASIKIPYYIIEESTNNKVWDFDYLLYPLNAYRGTITWDKKLMQIFENKFNIIFDIKAEENKIPELINGYSPNWYEYYQELLVCATFKTRAIINIIRDLGFYVNTESDYYAIYQESRMSKRDKRDYIRINYKTPTKEKTFNQLLKEILNIDKIELNAILDNISYEELDNIIKTLDDQCAEFDNIDRVTMAAIEAIKLYISNIKENSSTLLSLYKKLEQEREMIKRKIFYMNLLLIINNESVNDVLGYYLNNAKQGPCHYEFKMGKNGDIIFNLEMVKKHIEKYGTEDIKDNYNVNNRNNIGKDLHEIEWESYI